MKKPFVDFRKLKEQVSIRRVIERYGWLASLKEQGARLFGPCPLCEGESTSFRVSLEKNCFKCFRCEAGGNVLDLVAVREDCSIRDAALLISEWFGLHAGKPAREPKPWKKPETTKKEEPVPEGPVPSVSEVREEAPLLESAPSPAVRSGVNPPLTFQLKLDPEHPWFTEVGLKPETVAEFGLGFCSKGVIGGRIAFPLHDPAGQLVGYAGRWPGENPPDNRPLWKYPKDLDLTQVAFPIHRLVKSGTRTVRFTCNPLEVVLAWQEGRRNLFAVLGGEINLEVLLGVANAPN